MNSKQMPLRRIADKINFFVFCQPTKCHLQRSPTFSPAGPAAANQDATEPAVASTVVGEAGLDVPEVTLQAFAGLLAEDNGPEWEVPLTVVETPTQSKSIGGEGLCPAEMEGVWGFRICPKLQSRDL